jgi:type IV secretion system protein VirD4
VLTTTWGATQWTAWRLGFQPQLGGPGSNCSGWPIYYPPAFFWWWYFYDAYAPPIFVEGAYHRGVGGFISIAVAIGMSVWRAREAKNVETYGSARWATPEEVKAAGLLGPDGVVLGRSTATISAMTVRSMCCASRRPVPARASASSCPRC